MCRIGGGAIVSLSLGSGLNRSVIVKSETRHHTVGRSIRLCVPIAAWVLACASCYQTRAAESNATSSEKASSPLAPLSTAEANAFVQEYYAALSRSDISAVVAKFAETVDYQGEGERDRAHVRDDLQKYVARWPVLSFRPEAITVSPKEDGSAAVTFNLVYSHANNTKTTSGSSTNNWIVRRVNGELQILAQREVVHANAVPTVDKSTRPQSGESEEALSDDDLAQIEKAKAAWEQRNAAGPARQETEIEIPSTKLKANASIAPLTPPPHQGPLSPAGKALPQTAPADFVVALDIGHSPLKGGAISARGIFEYEFNRRLVTELFGQLQSSGFTRSFVINPEGEEIHLTKRTAVANEQHADLFLAIHHDSVKDRYLKNWEFNGKTRKYCDDFHGYSIFISHKNPKAAESADFAAKLGRALLEAGFTPTLHHIEQENRPIIDKQKGIYAFDDLVVLKTAKMPAVLLECGVIVNRIEEQKLDTREYRNRLTNAIETAISEFANGPVAAAKSKAGAGTQ